MAPSMRSLLRSGEVSTGAAKHLRIGRSGTWTHGPKGTRGERSKMANFDEKSKVDEHEPQTGVSSTKAGHLKEEMKNAIIDNLRYAHEHGTDRAEITDWTWPD